MAVIIDNILYPNQEYVLAICVIQLTFMPLVTFISTFNKKLQNEKLEQGL